VTVVGGVVLLAGLAGPYVLGGLGAWLAWRTFRRWKANFDKAGGRANPANPFRHGPWTREARNAAFALRQHERLAQFFSGGAMNPALRAFMQGGLGRFAQQPGMAGAFGMGGQQAPLAADTGFLTQKARATLLLRALRHPALRTVAAAAGTDMPRVRSVRTDMVPDARGSGSDLEPGSVLLRVHEVSEIFTPDEGRSGSGVPRGVLTAHYVLRLAPEQLHLLQDEVKQFNAAMSAWSAAGVAGRRDAQPFPEPPPFEGPLFSCLQFESASWRPRQGDGLPVDLTTDADFRADPGSSTAQGGRKAARRPLIQEAEFEERPPAP